MSAHNHSYIVPGLPKNAVMDQVKLKKPHCCWAMVYTMMISWKRRQSFDPQAAIARVGPHYLYLYEHDFGLPHGETDKFCQSARLTPEGAGLTHESMADHDIRGRYALLKQHGLLWVDTRPRAHPKKQAGPGQQGAPHTHNKAKTGKHAKHLHMTHDRIVAGMRIEDLAQGHKASLLLLDPWHGRQYWEPYGQFTIEYEGAFKDSQGHQHHKHSLAVYYQVMHF
jgi:hypothetical protein